MYQCRIGSYTVLSRIRETLLRYLAYLRHLDLTSALFQAHFNEYCQPATPFNRALPETRTWSWAWDVPTRSSVRPSSRDPSSQSTIAPIYRNPLVPHSDAWTAAAAPPSQARRPRSQRPPIRVSEDIERMTESWEWRIAMHWRVNERRGERILRYVSSSDWDQRWRREENNGIQVCAITVSCRRWVARRVVSAPRDRPAWTDCAARPPARSTLVRLLSLPIELDKNHPHWPIVV